MSRKGELIGWIAADNSLYLLMDAAFAACQRLARETGQPIEVGPTALRKRIDTKRLILSREGGKRKRLTNRVSINGVKVTVLHIANILCAPGDDDDAVATAQTQLSGVASRTFRTSAAGAAAPIAVGHTR